MIAEGGLTGVSRNEEIEYELLYVDFDPNWIASVYDEQKLHSTQSKTPENWCNNKYMEITQIAIIAILLSLFIAPVNAAPTQVLSPVIGPLYQQTGPWLLQYDKWNFWQHQTGGHANGNYGIGGANDYYSWDVNLWSSTNNNLDAGQPVYAVASGTIPQTYGSMLNTVGTYGQVLIDHGGWYSGYLHMNNIQVSRGQSVTKDTILGYISHVSPPSSPITDHLHFVVYTGTNTLNGLISVNCIIQERSGSIPSLLDPPILVSPGSAIYPGTPISTLIPTFNWQTTGADQYGLYISDITNGESSPLIVFNSVSYGALLTGTSYKIPSGILQNDKKYRWNMNSHNNAGWGSPNTGRYYFQTPSAPTTGTIIVTSSPGDASVYLDNIYKGSTTATTSFQISSVSVGQHTVKVTKANYRFHYHCLNPLFLTA